MSVLINNQNSLILTLCKSLFKTFIRIWFGNELNGKDIEILS